MSLIYTQPSNYNRRFLLRLMLEIQSFNHHLSCDTPENVLGYPKEAQTSRSYKSMPDHPGPPPHPTVPRIPSLPDVLSDGFFYHWRWAEGDPLDHGTFFGRSLRKVLLWSYLTKIPLFFIFWGLKFYKQQKKKKKKKKGKSGHFSFYQKYRIIMRIILKFWLNVERVHEFQSNIHCIS